MKHVLAWLVLWVGLFWLWLLLAGDWNVIEIVAAACAATVAATIGEIARTRAEVRARVPLRWVARAWNVPAMVVVDFGIVVWALARRLAGRPVEGVFRVREFPAGGDDPVSVGVRVWVGLAATYSPNAYVVDVDKERQLVLVHDLVPNRKSEEPA